MPALSKLDYLHPQDDGPQIIFDALPIGTAQSFVVLLIVFSTSLGAVLIEVFNYLSFDFALIRKPGWSQPTKLLSRIAYLCCRYLSPACLLLVVVLLVSPLEDCQAVPRAFNALGTVLIDSVALIFVQRTMALYAWKSNVAVPLAIAYCLLVVSTALCVPFYGTGYRIPNTQFCAYDPHRNRPRTLIANVAFKTITMSLDLTLLILTLHRLIDGGLSSLWTRSPRSIYKSITGASFASFLVRQGFHFYVVQTLTEILFISIYYGATEVTYQVIGSALVFSIPPLAAAAAFRDMAVQASSVVTRHDTGVNEMLSLAVQASCAKASHNVRASHIAGESSSSFLHKLSDVELEGKDTSDIPLATTGPELLKVAGAPRPASRSLNVLGAEISILSYGQAANQIWNGDSNVTLNESTTDTHNTENLENTLDGVLVTTGITTRSDTVPAGSLPLLEHKDGQIIGKDNLKILEMQRCWPRLSSRSSFVDNSPNSHLIESGTTDDDETVRQQSLSAVECDDSMADHTQPASQSPADLLPNTSRTGSHPATYP